MGAIKQYAWVNGIAIQIDHCIFDKDDMLVDWHVRKSLTQSSAKPQLSRLTDVGRSIMNHVFARNQSIQLNACPRKCHHCCDIVLDRYLTVSVKTLNSIKYVSQACVRTPVDVIFSIVFRRVKLLCPTAAVKASIQHQLRTWLSVMADYLMPFAESDIHHDVYGENG